MESRLRASPEQFILLLEFMERHGDLSRPQPGQQGRRRGECMWQELAESLNSIGGSGVNKTAEKWKRVWSDWKTKTKKKASSINRDIHGTGGGTAKSKPLTPLEERIMSIIGITSITGHQALQEAGFEVPMQSVPQVERIPSPIIELTLPPLSVPDHANYTQVAPADFTPALQQPSPLTTPVPAPSNTTEQEARSPTSCLSTPRRHRVRQRRRRQTPFDKATSEFVAVEEHRLRLERERDNQLFDLEVERNRIESERIRLESQRIQLDKERVRLEAERIQVEEERARREVEGIRHTTILHNSINQLNSTVTALQSRLETFYESADRNKIN